MFHATLWIEYHFAASDGSEIVALTAGEATDSGDKACNKAMASALKYALTQTFSIPTEEAKDTEQDHPELSQEQPQKPKPELTAALLQSAGWQTWLRGHNTPALAIAHAAKKFTVGLPAEAYINEWFETQKAGAV